MARSALQLRLEANAAYEASLRDEFRIYPDAVALFRHHFRNTPFRDLYKRRRLLLRQEYWPMLHSASACIRHFVRDPNQWRARGHSVPTLLWSLVRHLYCRYPMPQFWLAEWMRDHEDCSMARLESFALLGQGESVYRLSKDGRLGYDLSRKEAHLLAGSWGVHGLGPAVRMAQTLGRGGSRWLGHQLGRCVWGDWPGRASQEARRSNAVTWLCRQPELTAHDVDFVAQAVDACLDLELTGRTLASVREFVRGRNLARINPRPVGRRGRHTTPPPPKCWFPSTFRPMVFSRGRTREAEIRELTTLHALHVEGARLSHCVVSYAAAASRGECSIWSMRVAGMSILTIEVRDGVVTQVRGKLNRSPTASERKLVARWARHNTLAFREDC